MSAQTTNENLPVRIGRYEVVLSVAAGTPSTLFVVRLDEPGTTRPLTIRRIAPDVTHGKELDAFFESVRPTLSLHHPNVATVREIKSEQGETYVVMDLLEGESAAALIHRLELDSRSLGFGLAAYVVAAAARGLDAAHEVGLLHEHLTPSDVFVGHDGSVKVLDIGIARAVDVLAGNTTVNERDLPYAAPERCKGDTLDRRCDVFSLGALLWELMMGVSPFERATQADTLRAILREDPRVPSTQVLRNLPTALSDVVTRALARDRQERYPTARALADDLEAFVKDFPFGGARPSEPLATLMQSLFAKRIKNNARILRRLDSARMPSRPDLMDPGPDSAPPSRASLEMPTVDVFSPVALAKLIAPKAPPPEPESAPASAEGALPPVEPSLAGILTQEEETGPPPQVEKIEPAPISVEAAPVSLDAADLVEARPPPPPPAPAVSPPPPVVSPPADLSPAAPQPPVHTPAASSPVTPPNRVTTPTPAPSPIFIRDEALDPEPPRRTRSPLPFVVVAGLLVAASIGILAFYTRSNEPPKAATVTPERSAPVSVPSATVVAPSATASARPAAVVETTLHIETTPPKATVVVAGSPAGTTPLDLKLPRSKEPVAIEIRLPGYQTLRESVVPDIDQRLKLSLVANVKTPAPNATPYHRFE